MASISSLKMMKILTHIHSHLQHVIALFHWHLGTGDQELGFSVAYKGNISHMCLYKTVPMFK